MPYSQLEWEDERAPSDRRTSVQYIPDGSVKRILMFLALVTGTTIMIVYRQHPGYQTDIGFSFGDDSSIDEYEIVEDIKPKSPEYKPQWSWTCEDGRCERSEATDNSNIQSLKTCQMLCLTTPIWPQPTIEMNLSKTIVPLNSAEIALQIVKSPSKEVTEHIVGTFELFKADIKKFDKSVKANTNAKNIIVRVLVYYDENPGLFLRTVENYRINVYILGENVIATAEGETFVGARHALETLTQLIWFDTTLQSLVAYESANIEDTPKFIYRGLNLDTSRHFFPVEDIIRTLDAMAASKLNTFHWHATDSQSFPLMLNSVPQLALYGAYSRREVYTVNDVKKIVQHARLRGIRVVIEIDAPAHVGRGWSWGQDANLGDLAFCVEEHPWHGTCGEPPCGQLNPENDNVYEILEKIYKEIIDLTGVHDVFHLGGDEVNSRCWNMNLKTSDTMQIWLNFIERSLQSLVKANDGKVPELTIIWSSGLTKGHYLNAMKNYTIQLWGDSKWKDMLTIPDAGIKSIVSHVNACYLDCGFGSWRGAGDSHCNYASWKEAYTHRPWKSKLKQWHISGGTACMWSEQLGPEGLDSRVWPRAAAFAERLWSDPDQDLMDDVSIRLDLHRQRLIDRGIRAEPIWSQWCSNNPYKCGDI